MKNQIHLSDNLALLRTLPSESIDLIYCDILYGTGRQFNDYTDIQPKKADIYDFYVERITEMHRVFKTNGQYLLANGHTY